MQLTIIVSHSNKKQKMKPGQQAPKNIDDYIAQHPKAVQDLLMAVRQTIKQAAPGADEKISYQIPTFYLKGNLVHFAAWKKHIGFYPAASGIAAFQQTLSGYEIAKGSVQFPYDKPIPYGLISKIVEFRVKENFEKANTKKKK